MILARGRRALVAPICVAFALAIAVTLAEARPAWACSASGTHCYTEAFWIPGSYTSVKYTGAVASIAVTRLTSASCGTHTTAELWVDDQLNGYYWKEAGWHTGLRLTGSGCGLALFWAESPEKPGTSGCGYYRERYVRSPSFGRAYSFKISYNTSAAPGTWGVYIDGDWIGNTTPCHEFTLADARSGEELTDDTASVSATSSSLQKRGPDNKTWSYGWPQSGAIFRAPKTGNPGTGSWAAQDAALAYRAN